MQDWPGVYTSGAALKALLGKKGKLGATRVLNCNGRIPLKCKHFLYNARISFKRIPFTVDGFPFKLLLISGICEAGSDWPG